MKQENWAEKNANFTWMRVHVFWCPSFGQRVETLSCKICLNLKFQEKAQLVLKLDMLFKRDNVSWKVS
jgi:hypothetical protein